jgi:hypothetical protein
MILRVQFIELARKRKSVASSYLIEIIRILKRSLCGNLPHTGVDMCGKLPYTIAEGGENDAD